MKFSPDLIARVRYALDRMGYCFLSADELARLFRGFPENRHAREKALLEFAEMCGADVETTPHLKSARFASATPPSPTSNRSTPLDGSLLDGHAA
jgi:hypothetical protein